MQEYLMPGAMDQPSLDIVGVGHRERELVKALGKRPELDKGVEHDVKVFLIPEPGNPHDPNAVAVHVNDQHLGYLDAATAISYSPIIQDLARQGRTAVTNGRLWSITRENFGQDVGRKTYGRLTLALPQLAAPLNATPLHTEKKARNPKKAAVWLAVIGGLLVISAISNFAKGLPGPGVAGLIVGVGLAYWAYTKFRRRSDR